MAQDDYTGELLRDKREEAKNLFCVAYRAWIREKHSVAIYLDGYYKVPTPVGTFKTLDKAWEFYVQARDYWVSFIW